ncbi:NAC transcription factor 25 [Bienertia sinuspersici]
MEQQHQLINNNIADEKSEYNTVVESYPTGYRFIPLNKHLIFDYLIPKINGSFLHTNFIHQVDFYTQTPEYLTEHYKAQGEKIWYFFTQRHMSNKIGIRSINGKDNVDGYWKDTRLEKTIMNDESKTIGFRKTLVYYKGKPGKGEKTDWIMQEFQVDSKLLQEMDTSKDTSLKDDHVLCRIYKKADGIGKYRNTLSTDDEMSDDEIVDDAEDEINSDNEQSHISNQLHNEFYSCREYNTTQ